MAATSIGADVPDRGPPLRNLLWILTGLALATVMLRIHFRIRNRLFGWDDIFMLITTACFVIWSAIVTRFTLYGGAEHVDDVRLRGADNFAQVQFLIWLSLVFSILGVSLGKVSISVLLLNIIGVAGMRRVRHYLWIVPIVLTAMIGIACCILTMSQCRPAKRLWDSRVDGTCLAPEISARFGIFAAAWNTFVDASLAVIPLSIFWRLNCSVTEKVQLSIVFGLNILASICSGIKTQYITHLFNRADFTWSTYDLFVWITAELFLIIVCGTIPTLLVSVRRLASIVRDTMSSSTKSKVLHKTPSGAESNPRSFYMHAAMQQGENVTRITHSRHSESGESIGEIVGNEEVRMLTSDGVRVKVSYDVTREAHPERQM